jgi:aminoglycoside phosphotransferase (APT) family kinase protein
MKKHVQMIKTLIASRFGQTPKFVRRITIGICNEVYDVGLEDKEVIVRFSPYDRFLLGSHDHIPKFKALGIKVPDILVEDYSKTEIPFAYQIQSKIEGCDLGSMIENLTDQQLRALAKEVVTIFNKLKTIPASDKFGVIWGGGDNEVSETWTERMRIWVDESCERGRRTGVMDKSMLILAENLYVRYKPYFDSVKAVTYYGDICSKNVMVHNGIFNGLVDLDGLTQGDPLEASWQNQTKLVWHSSRRCLCQCYYG